MPRLIFQINFARRDERRTHQKSEVGGVADEIDHVAAIHIRGILAVGDLHEALLHGDVHLQNGDVYARVRVEHARGMSPALVVLDINAARAVHDVRVGDGIAVFIDVKAAAADARSRRFDENSQRGGHIVRRHEPARRGVVRRDHDPLRLSFAEQDAAGKREDDYTGDKRQADYHYFLIAHSRSFAPLRAARSGGKRPPFPQCRRSSPTAAWRRRPRFPCP